MKTSVIPYHPIACSFYDRLQDFATSGEVVKIKYFNSFQNQSYITDKIIDVYTESKAEYIRLKRGMTIRLDQLISAGNDRNTNETCGIDPTVNPCGDADEY